MSAYTDKVIDGVIKAEGGYVDHPNDKGGPTKYGITQAVARANGYTGDMRDLPESLARSIYFKRYISEPKFDQVLAVNEAIGTELIDTGVNMGPSRPAEMLQRWLNGFNDQGSHYPDVFVDGRLGPVTLDALRKFLAWRGVGGVTALLRGLNSLQATKYLEFTEADKTQRAFLYGWMTNRVS